MSDFPHPSLPPDYASPLAKARKLSAENRQFLRALKKKTPRDLDDRIHDLHQQAFDRTDCLQCANCCKTTSPIFYQKDIERAAKALRMKPGQFIDAYLRIDEEQDYVLKQSPCAFLLDDNTCSIYESRPTACREYPHTDRKRMHQILDLTYRNTLVCPAVANIIEKLKSIY